MVAACKDCSLPPRLPEPGKRGFSCPSGQAQKKNWQLQEQNWTDRQTSWLSALCYSVELRKFLRLNWTFCLKNRNQNKLRFSHWFTEKFGKNCVYSPSTSRALKTMVWRLCTGRVQLWTFSRTWKTWMLPSTGWKKQRWSWKHSRDRQTDRQIAEMWQEEHIAGASYTRSAAVSATPPAQYSRVVRRGRGDGVPHFFR